MRSSEDWKLLMREKPGENPADMLLRYLKGYRKNSLSRADDHDSTYHFVRAIRELEWERIGADYMPSLIARLNDEQVIVMCSALNGLSSEGHPLATRENLRYFQPSYVREIMDMAESAMADKGIAVVKQIKAIAGWNEE